MRKLLFFAILGMACMGLQSCVLDADNTPDFNIKEQSANTAIVITLEGCSYSAAAKRFFTQAFPDSLYRVKYLEVSRDYKHDEAYEALKSFQHYYDLDEDQSPWIAFGNKYIQGWDFEKEQVARRWMEEYKREKPFVW